MKVALKYIFTLVAIVLFASYTKAQDTLSIASNWDKNRLQDSLTIINPPQFLRLSYEITGNDATPQTANIRFEFYVKNLLTPSSGVKFFVDSTTMFNRTFVKGEVDSVDIYPTIEQNQSSFRTGINGIVIWPRSNNGGAMRTIDSLQEDIYVLLPNTELTKDSIVGHVYPNPCEDRISLIVYGNTGAPERVRILDLSGRTVFDGVYEPNILVGYLQSGSYIIQCYTRNKIIKQIPLVKF